jgi:hypothetical protein
MYNYRVTELKSKYTQQILCIAARAWRKKKLSVDEMADRLVQLESRLETAGKSEFIKIFESYAKRGENK